MPPTSRRAVLAATLALGSILALPGPATSQASGTLTIYTSQPTNLMAEVTQAFAQAQPGVKVEVFRSGTTEVMNKLQAEFAAGNPQADLVFIADAVATTQLKNDNRLLAYREAPVAGLPKGLYDPDMTFFGTKMITTGIAYNTNLVRTPPRSWNDLRAAEAARATIMPSPLYSGAAAIHVGTLVQQPAFGWQFYETLAQGGAQAARGNGAVLEAVARGDKAYGVIVEFMALNAKAKGSPVGFVFPEDGVSVISEPVAILRTARNQAAAKAFVDFTLSRAGQELWVRQGYFPILPGLNPPAGYPAVADVKAIDADPARILREDEATKRRFAELFGG